MTYKEFVAWVEETFAETHHMHDLGETVVVAEQKDGLKPIKFFITKDGDVFVDVDWYGEPMGSIHTRIAKGKTFEQIKNLINFLN